LDLTIGRLFPRKICQHFFWTWLYPARKIAPVFKTQPQEKKMNSNRSAISGLLSTVIAIVILGLVSSTYAQDVWVGGVGNWFNGGNWSAGVPTGASNAQVNNGGTANITGGAASAANLALGFANGDSGTASLTDSATLAIGGDLAVGGGGNGTLQIAVDSTGVTANRIFIGGLGGATGLVNITGPNTSYALTSTGDTHVGYNGSGTMNISDGAGVHTMGDGYIGFAATSGGLVQVSGVNGFPSEWTVDGRLAVGNLGRGELDILDGGEVDPTRFTIGRLAGSDGFAMVDGAGSRLNVAANLFVGGDIGGPGGAGELDITNGGSVNVGNNMTVWGPGSDGRAVLEVDSTYMLSVAGTLTFDGGILRFADNTDFTNNATLGTTTGSVGMVADTNGTTSTLSGLLTGLGGLTVNGGGTLFITNFNTFSGATVVNDASVFIEGSVGGNAVVNANGLLGGNGFVAGNVVNNGVVAPGDSPGTLTIGGDYTQSSTGDFSVETGGLSSGVDSDLLQVFGGATIDGSMHVTRYNNFMPLPGDRVTVLSTNNGVNGVFADVIPVGWVGLIQPFADYGDPFTVDIVFQLSNSFASQGITPNQISVGEALDNAVLDNCVPRVIAYLGQVPLADLPGDYDLIAPEEMASIYEMGFTQARIQGVNLMQRMDDIRAGSNGFCSTAVMQMPAPAPIYSKESDGKEAISKNPAPAFVATPENRWGIWVTGSGQFVSVSNGDDNAAGYDLSNGNFLVGVDYRLLHNLAFGIYGGYDAGQANLVNNGRITTNGANVGGFATFFWDRFYADVSGGGTWNNYKTRRTALLGDAIGSASGTQYNVLGALGYDWHMGCLNVGPRGTFQYTNVNIDSFGERGSLAPLDFPNQSEDSLQSTVGVRASYDLHSSSGKLIFRPELSVAWWHEYNDSAYPIDARFFDCPSGFTVWGPSVGTDAAEIRAGASAQISRAFAVYVYYDGLLGRNNSNTNGVSGGFTWSF
jgi:outer membrane autotransporter protein